MSIYSRAYCLEYGRWSINIYWFSKITKHPISLFKMAFPAYSFLFFCRLFPSKSSSSITWDSSRVLRLPQMGQKNLCLPTQQCFYLLRTLRFLLTSFLSYWVINSYGDLHYLSLHSSKGLVQITHSIYGSQILGEQTNIGLWGGKKVSNCSIFLSLMFNYKITLFFAKCGHSKGYKICCGWEEAGPDSFPPG